MQSKSISEELKEKRLEKTGLEQAIWREILELEEQKTREQEFDRLNELNNKARLLKEKLSELHGENIQALQQETIELRTELEELRKKNRILKKHLIKLRQSYGEINGRKELIDKEQKELRLCKLLLNKYSSSINENVLTIHELKSIINPNDLSIQSLISGFKQENYEFEKQFLETAKQLYDYLCKNTEFIHSDLEINFWLNPKEVLAKGIGESEDLSVLLCSAMIALGNQETEIMVFELEDGTVHSLVKIIFENKAYLLDLSQKNPFEQFSASAEKQEELLQQYSFEEKKIKRVLYKFNNKEYEMFA